MNRRRAAGLRGFALTVAAGLVAGSIALGGSASGAVRSVDDPVGDAPADYDISKVTVRNRMPAIQLRTHYEDLIRREAQYLGHAVRPVPGGATYVIFAARRPSRNIITQLFRFSDDGDRRRLFCGAKSRWDTRRNVVVVRIPQKCLSKQGRIAVNTYIGPMNGPDSDPVDFTDVVRAPLG